MIDVLVAVPAHDEQDEIGDCLAAVLVAARAAVDDGTCRRVTIGVGANRCADATARVARASLEDWPDRLVVVDDDSRGAGAARAHLIEAALTNRAGTPGETWIFNTDADSRVPVDWIAATVRHASAVDAAAVTGMVELREWEVSDQVREDYRALVATGVTPTTHAHVYGANLAVRLDAYRRVGGFAPVHGEDQDLVDRLRLGGHRVVSAMSPTVLTSAREPGRALGGLGSLLRDLRAAREPVELVASIHDEKES